MSAPGDTQPSPPPVGVDSAELVEAFADDVEQQAERLRTAAHDLENIASGLRRVAAEARR